MGVGRSIIVACLNSNRSLASWQSIGESRFEWSARSPINCDADRRLREGLARRSRAKDARIAMSARWRPAAGRSTSVCARTTFHRRPNAAGSIGRAQNWRASRFRVNAMASRPQTQTTRSQIVSPRIETHRGRSPPLNRRSFTSYSTQASEISAPAFLFWSGARRRNVAFNLFLQGHAHGPPEACSPEFATGAQRVNEMLRNFCALHLTSRKSRTDCSARSVPQVVCLSPCQNRALVSLPVEPIQLTPI